jgi:DNA recombination protein Rad52
MDWDKIKPALDAKLDPKNVRKPDGKFGPKGDYIEGWHAIAEANRIFGHGNWSYTIKGLTKDDVSEGEDSKGNPQWRAAYTCIVTVKVGEVIREDVGFGSGFAKQIGDAIEGATKEAVTDALKRALRTFGNPFGLALYDKTRENVGVTVPPEETRDRIKAALKGAKDLAGLAKVWDHKATKEAMEGMPANMKEELREFHNDSFAYLSQAPEEK